MAGPGFTRDEVILALDALYRSSEAYPTGSSSEMIELSALLNRLPIHPNETRRVDFRTASGIAKQLERFKRGLTSNKYHYHVGELFYQIAFEYEGKLDSLHATARSIRNNEPYYSTRFGNIYEDVGFPEGVLLGHLHQVVEKRDGSKVPCTKDCEICGLTPEMCYAPCGILLEQHLLVSPIDMNGRRKYTSEDFITVCPTCHVALHKYRPWLNKENCGEVLR